MELMRTCVTVFSRLLTSYSYMIGFIIQKLFSRTHTFDTNHCGIPISRGYGGHCGLSSPEPPITNHCGQSIGGSYRGHC